MYSLFGLEVEQIFANTSAQMRSFSIYQIELQQLYGLIGKNEPERSVDSYLVFSYFCFFVPFLYVLLRPAKFLAGAWLFGIWIAGLILGATGTREHPRDRYFFYSSGFVLIGALLFSTWTYYSAITNYADEQDIYTSPLFYYLNGMGSFTFSITLFASTVICGWNIGWFAFADVNWKLRGNSEEKVKYLKLVRPQIIDSDELADGKGD